MSLKKIKNTELDIPKGATFLWFHFCSDFCGFISALFNVKPSNFKGSCLILKSERYKTKQNKNKVFYPVSHVLATRWWFTQEKAFCDPNWKKFSIGENIVYMRQMQT